MWAASSSFTGEYQGAAASLVEFTSSFCSWNPVYAKKKHSLGMVVKGWLSGGGVVEFFGISHCHLVKPQSVHVLLDER